MYGGTQGTVVYPKNYVAQTYEEAAIIRTAKQPAFKEGALQGQKFPIGGTYQIPRIKTPNPGAGP